jgi:hypothetical protein
MPELNLKDLRKDLRLPELRLPEMSRDDIAKALGEARKEIREVRKELADFRQDFEMPRVAVTSVELPNVDVTKIAEGAKNGAKQVADTARDNAKVVAKEARKAAEQAGLVKRSRMSRLPFVLAGIVTLGLVTWAFANSPSVKARLRDGAQRARERMNERRTAWDLDEDTRAFDAASTAGVAPSTYSDTLDSSTSPFSEPPSPLPEGLGSDSTTSADKDMPTRA